MLGTMVTLAPSPFWESWASNGPGKIPIAEQSMRITAVSGLARLGEP